MKYCTKCGEQNPDEAKFCPKCGHPFVDETMLPSENITVTQSPKSINIVMGIFVTIYVIMTILFMMLTIDDYATYQNSIAYAKEYRPAEYKKYIVVDPWENVAGDKNIFIAKLCYTIGAFVSLITLCTFWNKKNKVSFYTYVTIAFISIITIISVSSSRYRSSYIALDSLYLLGLLFAVIVFSLIKIKGKSLYESLK